MKLVKKMEQAAQGNLEGSIRGDVQNPNGPSPGHPVLVDHVLSKDFGPDNLQRSHPAPAIL